MQQKTKRSLFFSFKKRIQNHRLTFINTSAMVILMVVVVVVLLHRAGTLQQATSEESLINLAGMIAVEAQASILTQLDVTRSIAQPIIGFANIEPEQRRSFFWDTMMAGIVSNNNLLNVFTLWKPGELDGMDASFENAAGHDETGQFIAGFTRVRGWVEYRNFGEYRHLLDQQFTSHFGFGVENVSQPRVITAANPRAGFGTGGVSLPSAGIAIHPGVNVVVGPESGPGFFRETWVADVQIPILADGALHGYATEIVGLVGATLSLQHLQGISVATRPGETGHVFVVSNEGVVIAHPDLRMRGVRIPDAAGLPFTDDVLKQLQDGINHSVAEMEPVILRTGSDLIVIYPFSTTSTISTAMTDGFALNPPWAVITVVPMSAVMATIHGLVIFSVFFIVVASLVTIFILWTSSSSLTQHAIELQHNLERASAMQDNLKYGLFLMDKNHKIQRAYSKALEKIMSVSNLRGKDFIELLANSTKEKERESLADYFEMILKQSFDNEMLERINPIYDLEYVSIETGEHKSLRTTFTIAEQGNVYYILGTIEDVTAEKELTKQLREAEALRENEMRSLFQVIQLNPRVLKDFVADVEDEFERINEALKDKKVLELEILKSLFQSIHAIKSNALILNLDGFAQRLHTLESTIKKLQETHLDVVPLDDILTVVFEINDAMREVDRLKETVDKIEEFRTISGEKENQEQYVLIETLSRVCEKTQIAVNKKASLIVDELDEAALDYGPRRAIKEILTQLVRNAVYHGIEAPEDREFAGKNPEGEIRLSIKLLDNNIRITLVDDGNGLDFERIKKHAEKITSSTVKCKNLLLKTIFLPGFSTTDAVDFHAGRGIGLSLVRDQVKALDGSIKVATTKGTGTRFTITIPVETTEFDMGNVS